MLDLRPFNKNDIELVYKWRNTPYIVNLGSTKSIVSWDDHLKWFTITLNENSRKAFILEINGIPAGQIRFDKETEDICYISIYLLEEFSGKGYGISFIESGCKKIFEEWPLLKKIIALVRVENIIGQKFFKKAGFISETPSVDKEHLRFDLNKV